MPLSRILWLTLLVSKINVFGQLTAPHQPLTFTAGCMVVGGGGLVKVVQTTMKTDLIIALYYQDLKADERERSCTHKTSTYPVAQ